MIAALLARELRQQARRRGPWLLRMAGVAVLTAAAWLLLERHQLASPRLPAVLAQAQGRRLFDGLHQLLLMAVCLLAPLLTADSLSRERREGTLGLLFLTPLRPGGIVAAKLAAHALAGLGLLLAALPVLMIPVLAGGVTWLDAARAAMQQMAALTLALAAGMLASTLCVRAGAAWLLAGLLTAVSLTALVAARGVIHAAQRLAAGQLAGAADLPATALAYTHGRLRLAARQLLNPDLLGWAGGGGTTPGRLAVNLLVLLAALALAGLVLHLARRTVVRTWRDQPPGPRAARLAGVLTRPLALPAWVQARPDGNPIARLGRRSWRQRCGKWAWAALFLVASWPVLGFRLYFEEVPQTWLMIPALLVLMAAAEGVAALRAERESGVLELLLTTPLPPARVLAGLLRTIWRNVWPALVVVFSTLPPDIITYGDLGFVRLQTLVTALPAMLVAAVAAMHLALRTLQVMPPFVAGAALGLLLLAPVWPFVAAYRWDPGAVMALLGLVLALETALSALLTWCFAWLFCRRLARRAFTLA